MWSEDRRRTKEKSKKGAKKKQVKQLEARRSGDDA